MAHQRSGRSKGRFEMKFEVGKLYKTRDGRKARVICVDSKYIDHPIVALVESKSAGEDLYQFKSDGKWVALGESDLDLIAEWKEPFRVSGKVEWIMSNLDAVPCGYNNEIPFQSLIGKKGTMTFVEDVE